jgi:crotonobetainyl-CoA:carnitine CoA-transferase CaiB-like acyl-CoA transferase
MSDDYPGIRRLPYTGLKVIELSDNPAGDLSGKLLADSGATVLKVEAKPFGSPLRQWGPFVKSDGGQESLSFWYYNTSKLSAVCDFASRRDRHVLLEALSEADTLITTWQPHELTKVGLDICALRLAHPQLIIVNITPFGTNGPRQNWATSDLVSLALGGILHSCGYDDHSIPPIRPAENQSFHCAASFGHIGVLLALLERQRTGLGQVVDIAVHDAVYLNIELANPYWFYSRALSYRQMGRHAQPSPTLPSTFRCADGRYVYLMLVLAERKPWRSTVEWLESHNMDCGLADPAFDNLDHRQRNFAQIHSVLEGFFLTQAADTVYREGQDRGLPIGIVNSPADVLNDKHLRARGFFQPLAESDDTTLEFPGVPFHFSAWRTPTLRRPPGLGNSPLAFPDVPT